MEDVKEEVMEETGEKTPYLDTWKTREEAEKGLANLKSTLDKQGNELGSLRKQMEFSQQMLNDMRQPKSEPPQAPNYDKEISAIHKEMAALDPVEDGYQENFLTLLNKAENLTRQQTLEVASQKFKQELDERDIKAAHSSFYEQNPDFSTPEMQVRIQEYLAKDKTGMSDPLVAYREIQRDDIATIKAQLEADNVELKRLLELKKGEAETGKVVTKGQSPQQKTKQPKAIGAELDRGMQEALNRLRE